MSTGVGDTMLSAARAWVALLCVAVVGLAPRPARSVPPTQADAVVVSDLVLSGDVMDDHWRLEFLGGLARGLARAGFRPQAPATEDCVDVACLRQQARESDATAVIVASVTVRDRFYAVRLQAFDPNPAPGATPVAIAVVEEECPICGPGEVTALLERTVTVLARKLPKHVEPGRLTVRSVPPGAAIELDGKAQGMSPMDIDLEPGKHRLVVTAPGYVAQEFTTTSVSNVRETWEPMLQQLDPVRTPRQRQLRIAGWASAGAGAGAAVASIVFLALDRRPFPPSCGSAMLDADGDCPRIYRTLPHGGIMLGATVAFVVTSAVLLAQSRKTAPVRSRARRRSAGRAPPRPVAAFRW